MFTTGGSTVMRGGVRVDFETTEPWEATEYLRRLVLALGHDVRCSQTQNWCSCGKAQELTEIHGEACRFLRECGVLEV